MRFRPCIDLRQGRVVQVVGGSFSEEGAAEVITNFETDRSPADYARMYRADNLTGGHVISLGPGNHAAALQALEAFPGGMHVGGGINADNAGQYLDAGASHVIVTSYVFRQGQVDRERLAQLLSSVGRERLVLDLSCRKKGRQYYVVTDRWQRFTEMAVNEKTLTWLADYCDEFLVHGVDVEGKRAGIETCLVEILGQASPVPVTYAGGAGSLADLDRVKSLGRDRVDLTIGSALDIFGGQIPYRDVVAWHKAQQGQVPG